MHPENSKLVRGYKRSNAMTEVKDPYYLRTEVSNSDLSWLNRYWQPVNIVYDLEKAYAFGTLIDCILTEPHKVNYFKLMCAGRQYTKDDFELAEEMKRSFWRDELCASIASASSFQKISVKEAFEINYEGLKFYMAVRCKWDLWNNTIPGDIKSTMATTQKQFEQAVIHFEYNRQSAWYMDLENVNKFIIIGISKVNKKIFKVPITRGSELYNSGKQKYQDLAFKWFCLFGDLKNIAA